MLHHIAFTISGLHSEAEKEQLINLGLEVEVGEHARVHYRCLYITDPGECVGVCPLRCKGVIVRVGFCAE
jgi:hypothetical protein